MRGFAAVSAARRSRSVRVSAFACALALLLCLFGCGQQPAAPAQSAPPAASPTPQSSTPPPTEKPAESSPPAQTETDDAPFGSPWVDSLLSANAPAQTPEAKDDLYLHFNCETLRGSEGVYFLQLKANPNEMTDYVTSVIKDASRHASPDGAYSEAELEQLRIFFGQAADLETLRAARLTELEPYLERVRAAETLEELNGVLAAEDFPFSPFLYFTVSAYDMSAGNNVFIYPEFLFVDNFDGAEHYQNSDDPAVMLANRYVALQNAPQILLDLYLLGLSEAEAEEKLMLLLELESAYGAYAGYNDRYLSQPFGAFGAATVNLSLDELAELCPNYPVRETVEKLGKAASPFFSLFGTDWLQVLSAVWIEDNLEILKLMTMAKILRECDPYVDKTFYAIERGLLDANAIDPTATAVYACNRPDTFSLLIGKIYTADHYGDAEIARLTTLGEKLIAAFRRLIDRTPWLGEASREKLTEKLDHMRLNILSPDGGYPDFSDLGLVPTEEGGSLLGNYLKLKAWRNARENALLGRDALVSWNVAPTTNAGCYYDFDTNSINILPGFPASQNYGPGVTDETLLATYGWMMAHEISHGFDFSGAQFDAYGTANPVFDETDLDAYLAIVDRLAAYYDGIEVLPGTFVVGDRVKNEAAADLIGLQLVLELAKEIPGFDYDAFFGSAARYMFMVVPSEVYVQEILADEHPAHYLRINVNAQMCPEFYETYGVSEGDGMYLPASERIRFWGE